MAHRFRVLASICAATVLLVPGQAIAASGALDRTFSGNGKVSTPDQPETDEWAEDVAIQPDGRIVVVGWRTDWDTNTSTVMAARYLEDGTPDPAFGGGDGIVTLPIGPSAAGSAVALLSDQRIAIAGSVQIDTSDFDAAAFLLTTAGELDSSFDDDGVSVVRFGGDVDFASGIDVDSSDRIVLAGSVQETAFGGQMAIARLTSEGVPDSTFSSDGKRTIRFPSGQTRAQDVEIQANGRIVLAGRRLEPGGFALARLLPGGALDTAYSDDGRVVTGSVYGANALSLQPDGKVIAAGKGLTSSPDFMLVRYRANGSLDRTFHGDGIVRTNFDGLEDDASDVEVQPNGKIVAVGTVEIHGQQPHIGIARYLPSGIRDVTFSGDGKAAQVVGYGYGSAIDQVPRLLVVGSFSYGGGMGTARYLLT